MKSKKTLWEYNAWEREEKKRDPLFSYRQYMWRMSLNRSDEILGWQHQSQRRDSILKKKKKKKKKNFGMLMNFPKIKSSFSVGFELFDQWLLDEV